MIRDQGYLHDPLITRAFELQVVLKEAKHLNAVLFLWTTFHNFKNSLVSVKVNKIQLKI